MRIAVDAMGGDHAPGEIVKGAASEGVATQAYRDAVESAARAAEDAVYAEDIPLGYRLYVKRYFQTIQPPARDNR